MYKNHYANLHLIYCDFVFAVQLLRTKLLIRIRICKQAAGTN